MSNGRKFWIMPRARHIGEVYLFDEKMPESVRDWIFDHVYDIHEFNVGMYDDHIVIIDYALNTLNDPQSRHHTPSSTSDSSSIS